MELIFKQFLIEQERRKFSCVLAIFREKIREKILSLGESIIPDNCLYAPQEKGREDEPHVTVLYGIETEDPSQVKGITSSEKPFQIELGNISKFSADEYDVLKIEVLATKNLRQLHERIKKEVKNQQTYPNYVPHVTLAYAKKGSCDKHLGDHKLKGEKIAIEELTFSTPDGTQENFKLGTSSSNGRNGRKT